MSDYKYTLPTPTDAGEVFLLKILEEVKGLREEIKTIMGKQVISGEPSPIDPSSFKAKEPAIPHKGRQK